MHNIILLVFFSLSSLLIQAQSIDRIEAIIGDEMVLTSDFESQYLQYLIQGNPRSESVRCEIIEDIFFQKLLVNQAKLDSIVVSEEEIDIEVNKRLDYFISQLGSLEEVERYFGKSKIEIRLELSNVISDQFMAQRVQNSIVSDVKVTPSEVRSLFNKQDVSDMPTVPAKAEILQIVLRPNISDVQKRDLRDKLNDFRERVYKGEDFTMLAALYSDDVGSASKGGELGFVSRGDLVPEFERAAFRLKEGEISEVIESKFGFHIIQLIQRRGEQINVRHILLKAKVSSTSLNNAKLKSEIILKEINSGKITFEDAISKYSDDDSKKNGGVLVDPNTMSNMYIVDNMVPALKYAIEGLDPGQISSPKLITMSDDTQVYRILKLSKRVEAHQANLSDDFSMIKDFTLNIKKQDELMSWIKETIEKTYISINDSIIDCKFKNKWSR